MSTTQQYIEVEYSLSNRIRCQQCQQAIQKHEIRIGHVFVRRPEGYDKKIWYHLNCLQTIPKGDRNQDLDVVNIHSLTVADQQKVEARIKQLRAKGYQKKNSKEVKFLTKQEHYNTYVKESKRQFNKWVQVMKSKDQYDPFYDY